MKLQRNKSVIDWRVLETREKKRLHQGAKQTGLKNYTHLHVKAFWLMAVDQDHFVQT